MKETQIEVLKQYTLILGLKHVTPAESTHSEDAEQEIAVNPVVIFVNATIIC